MADTRQLPERVTLPLLTLITQQSFDEDYEQVAERRRLEGARTERPIGGSHRMAAVVVAIFGLLVATAAVQTSREQGVTNQSRATLISQISARSAGVSRLQDRIVALREGNVVLSARLGALTRASAGDTARLRTLETVTGYGPVTGPGVRIVVNDAPNGDTTQLVRDEDLATLVDGLWNAGAEAVAVNNQRLTALTAIRNVGITIHVNSRPVSPPYVVRAVGDERTLQARLLESTHGQKFYSLVDQLGFRFRMQNEDALELPSATLRVLRSAVARAAGSKGDKRMTEEATP
jgi:uncharacterized protein YlxW (UPF0749 family)